MFGAPFFCPMQLFIPTIAAQLDPVTSVLGVVTAVAISFIAITLVASYYRFQNIVLQAEETSPEEMGATAHDVLRVQLARYLAGCARRGTSFTLSLIRLPMQNGAIRINSPVTEAVKHAARRDDVTCLFDDQTIVLLLESEPEDGVQILTRISKALGADFKDSRAGLASYPGHGLSGKELLEIAVGALESTTEDEPIILPEIENLDEEEDDAESEVVEAPEKVEGPLEPAEEKSAGWREKRKNSMLDELTGVLKPSAISAYMQRTMSEIRRKKKKAALFCIGVNNMENIERIHGQDAADDVMAGVSQVLQDNLRADDLIGRHEKYAYLILSECTLEEAEIIGKRITTLVQQGAFASGNKKLKTTITLGVAAHPEHGRNLHLLYLAGQKVLDHSRANDIRAYAVYDPEIHDKVQTKPMKSIKARQA